MIESITSGGGEGQEESPTTGIGVIGVDYYGKRDLNCGLVLLRTTKKANNYIR